MNKVFLMGMPGSGKSTVGKKLAHKLQLNFIDLDTYIEEKEHKTIAAIFANSGEESFRQIETQHLQEVIKNKNDFFLSLGGGTPCFNNNIELIKKSGISIYLEVPTLMLIDRLKGNGKTSRPLFNGLSDDEFEKKVNEMLFVREPFYKQAHITISGKDLKPERIATIIREFLKNGKVSE